MGTSLVKILIYSKISINESRERTASMRAKREWLEKPCSSSFCENHDEDLKVISVSFFDSLFSKNKIDDKGTR